jgi:hypothetical protein
MNFDIDNHRYTLHIDVRRYRRPAATEQESTEMSEAYLTNWSFGGDKPNARSHFHDTALREARVATDHREVDASVPARESFLSRLRVVFAGRPAADGCNCPA